MLRFKTSGTIPANAPFVAEQEIPKAVFFKVKGIAGINQLGRFNLLNSQSPPLNIFIKRPVLARIIETEGKSNIILVKAPDNSSEALRTIIDKNLQFDDASLNIKRVQDKLEVTSDRIFIDSVTVDAFKDADEKILTYFVNKFIAGNNTTPYSFISTYAGIGHNEMIINDWLANDLKVKTGDTITTEYF